MKKKIWKRRLIEITKVVPFTAVPTAAPLFLQHSVQTNAGYLYANKSPKTVKALLNICNSKDQNLKCVLMIVFQ